MGFGDGVIPFPFRFPEHRLIRRHTRRTGDHSDFVRHNKSGVEAHPELADQLAVFGRVRAERFQESFGAGFGNGTQVVDDLIAGHPDTVITDGQGALFFIRGQTDMQITVIFIQ